MRRLDRVNDAIGRVVAGNVSERLPTIGISREFDLLSSNLNAMLDQIGADGRPAPGDDRHRT